MLQFPLLAASLIVALFLASPASASGPAARAGEDIAKRWCAECHAVSDDQTQASADLPSFDAIAEKYADEFDAFQALLADPHPDMPQMMLTQNDIRNLLAYLGALR